MDSTQLCHLAGEMEGGREDVPAGVLLQSLSPPLLQAHYTDENVKEFVNPVSRSQKSATW